MGLDSTNRFRWKNNFVLEMERMVGKKEGLVDEIGKKGCWEASIIRFTCSWNLKEHCINTTEEQSNL